LSEVVILGSGTGVPSMRRASPGLVVLSEDTKVLIDSGSGILRRMLDIGMTYHDIDLLLYTHLHPDHIADFVPILFACKYADLPREKDLLCLGGPGFEHHFNQLKTIYGRWIEPRSYQLSITEVSEKPFVFRSLKIFSRPMAHTPESVGYRIEFTDGRSVAVSGDTDYCKSIVDLAREADLLVLECSFPDGRKIEGHLTPSLAGRIASESHCRRLLLTHLYPVCDSADMVGPCRDVFKGDIILAEDLMRVIV
jgi:ribonuclease BN (tRNA processing enzyme)